MYSIFLSTLCQLHIIITHACTHIYFVIMYTMACNKYYMRYIIYVLSFQPIFSQKLSNVSDLQSYIPVNDEILVTLQIDDYVYTEQNFNCISNWYTTILMHVYLNSYSIPKRYDYLHVSLFSNIDILLIKVVNVSCASHLLTTRYINN